MLMLLACFRRWAASLIGTAYASKTIVVAKGGKPWARLVPLEPPPEDELACLEQPSL